MGNLSNGAIYYVANYAEGTISIVDGVKNEIVNKIICGIQSYDMVICDENKIFVANSGGNTISIIYANNSVRTLKIPNNGHVDVNFNISKIYVSNVNSVAAYDVEKGNLLWRVEDLYSVRFIKLNNSKNKLLILDDNMLKIFNAYDGCFIKGITVGNAPSFIEINENDSVVYISNTMDNSITVIDMNNLIVMYTVFDVGNAPIGMKFLQNKLYIVNSLGNNVTIVNMLTNTIILNISVGEGPERITSTPDGEKLIVSNTTDNTISVINSFTNIVETTILGFNQPIGIAVVKSSLDYTTAEYKDLTDLYKLKNINKVQCIREKKVISNCALRICFRDVMIKVEKSSVYPYTINSVRFSQGFVIPGTEKRSRLKSNNNFIKINFSLVIPCTLEYYDANNTVFKVNGTMENEEKSIVLYLPITRSELELKIIIETRSQLLNAPVFKNGAFVFSVGTFLKINIVEEVELLVPALGYCTDPPECEEYVDNSDIIFKEIFEMKLFPDNFYPRGDFFY
jgi:YVTN family beta-propeller protein